MNYPDIMTNPVLKMYKPEERPEVCKLQKFYLLEEFSN